MKVLKGWECRISNGKKSLVVRPGDKLNFKDEDGNVYNVIISSDRSIPGSKYINVMLMDENYVYIKDFKEVPLIDLIRNSIIKKAKNITDYTIEYRTIYKLLSDDNKILEIGDHCKLMNITGFKVRCSIDNIHYRAGGNSTIDFRFERASHPSIIPVILPTDEYIVIWGEL